MALQKVKPSMIDGGVAALGNVLGKVSPTDLGFFPPDNNPSTASLSGINWDPQSGTLTIIFPDGSQSTVDGLPTADQLRSGRQGGQGKRGLDGATGRAGRDGNDGNTGCPGTRGFQGRPGPTGNTGPIGNTGETGAPGPTGPTGNTGLAGRDAVVSEYVTAPVLDAVSGQPIIGAYQGSLVDPNSGYKRNFGRQKAAASLSTVNVIFNTAFVNRCVSLTITFLNAATNQARTYRIYNTDGTAVNENLLLGGFTLRSEGINASPWDFFYAAEGD